MVSARRKRDGEVFCRRCSGAAGSGGFTLIELLVVIAIIAILAAILFPVFARARSKAQQTVCLSNLKQIDLAFAMYANDYGSFLPYQAPSQNNGVYGWYSYYPWDQPLFVTLYTALFPYMRNSQLWFCVSDPCKADAVAAGGWGTANDAQAGRVSYLLCTQTLTNWGGGVDPMCPKPGDATTIISGKDPSSQSLMSDNGATEATDPVAKVGAAHSNGSNFAFLDGHVKYQSVGQWGRLHPPMVPTTPY